MFKFKTKPTKLGPRATVKEEFSVQFPYRTQSVIAAEEEFDRVTEKQ